MTTRLTIRARVGTRFAPPGKVHALQHVEPKFFLKKKSILHKEKLKKNLFFKKNHAARAKKGKKKRVLEKKTFFPKKNYRYAKKKTLHAF